MAGAVLWRWVIARLLREPAVGVLWLSFLLWMPLVLGLRPLATPEEAVALTRAWCYPAGLIGVLLAQVALSRSEAFLERLDPRTRWEGELGGLVGSALYLQLPMVAGALASGATPLDLARGLPDILTSDLRLAALALLVLVLASTTTLRALAFLGLCWLLPAFLADGALAGRAIAHVLDAGAALRAPTAAAWTSSLLVASALLIAGRLLRVRSSR